MIASVAGTVTACGADAAVLEVGGVGLSVHCTPATLAQLHPGRTARLATTLVVREESLTLYGFADEDERSLFEVLQTVSGVGPRVAQAMLAVLRPAEIRRAVRGEDIKTLTTVPGIGKKGAERLVLELRDKLGPAGDTADVQQLNQSAGGQPWREQVHGALLGLGWSSIEAAGAVDQVAPVDGEADVPAILRDAIRALGVR